MSAGARMISMNAVNGTTRTVTVSNVALGAELSLTQRMALRVQGGTSSFAHASNQFGPTPSPYGLPVYGKHTEVNTAQQYYATAGITYNILKIGELPVLMSLDLGTVFFDREIGALGMFGLASEIPVSAQFSLKPAVMYDV